MNAFNLPQDIPKHDQQSGDSIVIHDYHGIPGTIKGKSILHANAFSLVISGQKTMHFAEKKVQINDQGIHLLSIANCLASVDPKQKPLRSVLMFFDNDVLAGFYLKYDSLISSIKGRNKIQKEPYLSFPKDEFIRNFIQSLCIFTEAGRALSPQMKQLKFEELMLHLVEHYPERILAFRVSQGNDLEDLQIRKAAETNIANNITVSELAFLCNMSLSTFKRRFAKIYGTSPNKWLLKQRMEMAKKLLIHHREKPGEIFHKVGYESHSAFTQSFRQLYGITPKDFQQQKLNVSE
jgi:AraC-like DNA-binding protein